MTGGLVLALSTAIYAQEPPAAQSAQAAPSPSPTTAREPAAGASGNAAASPAFSFSGTDLRIGTLPPISFHGFGSQGFLASTEFNYLGDSTHGSFKFSEFALNASMSPFPRTRLALQGFAFDVGDVGGYYPSLDYALADYSFCDEIGVRAGRIRRPEGIYNAIQDIDLARTSILLPQGMYDARWRDFSGSIDGGSLYGQIGLGKAGSLSYEAYGGMVNLADNGGIARQLRDYLNQPPISSFQGVSGFPMAGAQLWYNSPIQGLRSGVSIKEGFGLQYDYRVNPPFGPGNMSTIVNTPAVQYSLEYQWKAWTFQAEYRTMNRLLHSEIAGNTVSHDRMRSDTWYVGAAYRINKWAEIGAYYTEDYNDVSNRSGAGTAVPSDAFQKDVALSLRFDPTKWWVIKLEGHAIKGTALLSDSARNPVRDDKEWFMLGIKNTFSF